MSQPTWIPEAFVARLFTVRACSQGVGKAVNGPHCNILAGQPGIKTRGVALGERPGYVVLVRLLVHHGNSDSVSAPHHANDAPHHANDAPHHANDAPVLHWRCKDRLWRCASPLRLAPEVTPAEPAVARRPTPTPESRPRRRSGSQRPRCCAFSREQRCPRPRLWHSLQKSARMGLTNQPTFGTIHAVSTLNRRVLTASHVRQV